ncbi:MAG: HEAT repeat domain-containing protein [Gemmatimonadales bacterium]
MRSTPLLVLLLAGAVAATAQTPAPPATPRPKVTPKAVEKARAPRPRLAPSPFEMPDFHLEMPDFHLDRPGFHWDFPHPELEALSERIHELTLPVMPELPLLPELPITPEPAHLAETTALAMAQMPSFHYEPSFGTPGARPKSVWLRAEPDQGTAEDSLYRQAHNALSRGEYARASTLFQTLEQKYPRSRVAPAALYYRAFALYRAGSTDELRAALTTLRAQQEKYTAAAVDPEAASLRTRIYAALASRGDREAESALRAATAQGTTCDKEEMEVRASALSALVQVNAAEARPTLQRVLARKDECSVTLRRRAVYLLGRAGTEESANDLLGVAKNDPDPSVRGDAIGLLARSSGTATVRTLEQLFNAATDDRTRQQVISALRSNGSPEARRALRAIIEREDLTERLRTDAILSLSRGEWVMLATTGQQGYVTNVTPGARRNDDSTRRISPEAAEDATYLRTLYAKSESRQVKSAIISAVARIGGSANDQWLMGIVRNRDEEMALRRDAINRLRPTTLSVEDIGRLFDALGERELRGGLISQLANREDAAATDKLIEIARSGTDPELRRMAISALARKKDPRSTKLLLELVEKP